MRTWLTHTNAGSTLGVFGVCLVLLSLVLAVRVVKRWFWRRRAMTGGVFAQGRVLDVALEPGDQGREPVPRAVVWFYALDGQEFRIEDPTGRPRALGEPVLLRYLPARPEWAVVAEAGPGTVAMLLSLAFLAFFALAGLYLVLMGVGLARA
ncbi:hypothetical protein DN069_04255 [Streptacidiphilus pinicola]|uniref:DUF3592 domain-containing protein n=1 Tax=Streptacidiphilus pinicola TaxID=2219663 RepID=A0A2X0ITD9_9ACTN|nr:hypothetical protein DN069_04255 [Streptacidiphilus pinicola]